MRVIYQEAIGVIAWLGTDAETAKALDDFDTGGYSAPTIPWQSRYGTAYEHLSRNRYWGRLWIVQELLLAKSIRLMCEDTTLPWDHLDKTWHANSQMLVRYSRRSRLYPLLLARRNLTKDRIHFNLEEALERFCDQHCHDLRDKVYGLVGIVRNTEAVEVNYGLDINQVFIATARKVMSQYASYPNRQRGTAPELPESTQMILWTLFKEMDLANGEYTDFTAFQQFIDGLWIQTVEKLRYSSYSDYFDDEYYEKFM